MAYCQTLCVSGSSPAVRKVPFLFGMMFFRHVIALAGIRLCDDTDGLPFSFNGHSDGLRRIEMAQIRFLRVHWINSTFNDQNALSGLKNAIFVALTVIL